MFPTFAKNAYSMIVDVRQRRHFRYVILLLTLGLGVSAWTIEKTLAAPTVSFFIEPGTGTLSDSQILSVKVHSSTNTIGFIRVSLTFDKTKLQLTNEITSISPFDTVVTKTSMNEANTTGSILLVVAVPPTKVSEAPSGIFEIAQIPVHVISETENDLTQIAFIQSDMQIVDTSQNELTVESQIVSYTLNFVPTPTTTHTPTPSTTPTVTPTIAPTEIPTLSVSPTPTSASLRPATLSLVGTSPVYTKVPSQFDIHLQTETAVSGVDSVILFDQSKIQIDSYDDHALLNGNTIAYVNNQNGVLRLSQVATQGNSFVGEGSLATIHFTPLVQGTTEISFEYIQNSKSDTNVIAFENGKDIVLPPSSLSLSIVNQAYLFLELETESENPTLGFATDGEITLTDGDWSTKFTTSKDGKAGSYLLPDRLVGSSQIPFYVKVDGYLKKIAKGDIRGGDVTIKFGTLRAGDLNNDGIVNTIDLSLLYDAWFSEGVADYNKDGIVNSADYWILTQNFFATDELFDIVSGT